MSDTTSVTLAGAVPLKKWQKAAGVSRTTAFYWRRSGKLKVIYRYGRAYVSAEESRRLLAEHRKEPSTMAPKVCGE
jgi:predicted site-specific integrase-resolvase